MDGKYRTWGRFQAARVQRWALRRLLSRLVKWEPLRETRAGYSVLIGCAGRLAPMVGADLKMLAAQQREHLDQVIVVVDRPEQETRGLEERMRRRFPDLPLAFAYYSPWQAWLLGKIGWGWAYSWLSWSMAIARTRTRYAVLQDFDALLLRRDILEERYKAIMERGDQYVGIRWYAGEGVIADDGLVITPEMVFDAAFVRERFRPIDLFNHVTMHRGRSVDFDTFLYAQATAGRSSVLRIDEEDMVHPSQMICQFTQLMSRGGGINEKKNNLLLIPYFCYLGGEEAVLREVTSALLQSDGRTVRFYGKQMAVGGMGEAHAAWLRKQAYRLEMALVGQVRPEVERYFELVETVAGQGVPPRHNASADAHAVGRSPTPDTGIASG